MRVIAGAWRGRRLTSLPGEAIRPTTGRVREALFSILGPRVAGAEVADLCCGAGALGIEALSRGATRVAFVDLSPHALRTTEANLRHCGAAPRTWTLVCEDAVAWLTARGRRAGAAPLIVLADPPYAGDLAARLLGALRALPPASGLVVGVVEHGADEAPAPAAPTADAPRESRRVYGRTALTILEA